MASIHGLHWAAVRLPGSHGSHRPTAGDIDKPFIELLRGEEQPKGAHPGQAGILEPGDPPGSRRLAARASARAPVAAGPGGSTGAQAAPAAAAGFPSADVASAASSTTASLRRPVGNQEGQAPRPDLPVSPAAPGPRSPGAPASTRADGWVDSQGTLSDDPHTAGMYVPPDFYHGGSYSPVFDTQDENGDWARTPRFEGQKIYSAWRASLPPDFDPNARVLHDPLYSKQRQNWWRQDESGNWVRREDAWGGIPLDDDGKPRFTPDPDKYPEYFKV